MVLHVSVSKFPGSDFLRETAAEILCLFCDLVLFKEHRRREILKISHGNLDKNGKQSNDMVDSLHIQIKEA